MKFSDYIQSNIRYLSRPPWDSGISPPELLDFIAERSAGRAIDLGCGTGTNLVTLARQGWQVTGVDAAFFAIAQARRKARQAQVKVALRVGDVVQLRGVRGPFDLALDMGCFHNLGERQGAYLERLDEILAPNGFWLLYAHLLPRDDGAAHGLSAADLARIAVNFAPVWEKREAGKVAKKAIWGLYQKR